MDSVVLEGPLSLYSSCLHLHISSHITGHRIHSSLTVQDSGMLKSSATCGCNSSIQAVILYLDEHEAAEVQKELKSLFC